MLQGEKNALAACVTTCKPSCCAQSLSHLPGARQNVSSFSARGHWNPSGRAQLQVEAAPAAVSH